MGTRTDQARDQVIAAREGVVTEADELRRSALHAVDVPARAREDPLRVGAIVAGGTFLAIGGPGRVLRRLRRLLLGAPAPKSLLPEEIESAVEGLGSDSEQVKRQLEREFADYLEERKAEREKGMVTGTLMALGGTVVNTVAQRAGQRLIQEFLAPPRRAARTETADGRSDQTKGGRRG